ncbi:MAG: HAMP domain-containing protein [Candidatus Nealsonbacteria bacterium]|nr:HAMP domain-containing protein [Candidatus Nealsonbacteria bacterium]
MKLSLFKKIGAGFLLGVIIPLGALIFFIEQKTTESIIEKVYERNQLLSFQQSLQIDAFSSTIIEGAMDGLSSLPEMNSENPERIREILNNYAQSFEVLGEKVFESFLLVDPSGKIENAYPYREEYIGLDYSHYDFFKAISDQKEEIYISSDSWISAITSRPMVRIAVPVKNSDNETSRVLVADISLNVLHKISEQIRLGETGRSFILDKKGSFISYPEKNLVLERQNVNNVFPDLFGKIKDEEFGVVLWPEKNPHTIFSFSSPDTVEWKVIFMQSMDEALEVPSSLQTMFRFTLVFVLLLTTVIVFLSTNLITKPIKKLRETAKEMAQGNLEIRTNIKTNDEIEDLSKEFDTMAEKLKKSKDSLETKVKERTKELEELTKTLEKRVDQRTTELKSKLEELERFRKFAVDRETRMIELKKEVDKLKERLKQRKENYKE